MKHRDRLIKLGLFFIALIVTVADILINPPPYSQTVRLNSWIDGMFRGEDAINRIAGECSFVSLYVKREGEFSAYYYDSRRDDDKERVIQLITLVKNSNIENHSTLLTEQSDLIRDLDGGVLSKKVATGSVLSEDDLRDYAELAGSGLLV